MLVFNHGHIKTVSADGVITVLDPPATADFQMIVGKWTFHRFCVMVLSGLHLTLFGLFTTGGWWRHSICCYWYGGWRAFRGILSIFNIMYDNFCLLCPTWKLAWSCLITEHAWQLFWGTGPIHLQSTNEHCKMLFAVVITCVSQLSIGLWKCLRLNSMPVFVSHG